MIYKYTFILIFVRFNFKMINFPDIRYIKREYHPTSDHQSLYWIVGEYENLIKEEGKWGADNHCREKFMRTEKLNSVISNYSIFYYYYIVKFG